MSARCLDEVARGENRKDEGESQAREVYGKVFEAWRICPIFLRYFKIDDGETTGCVWRKNVHPPFKCVGCPYLMRLKHGKVL